MSYLLSSSNHNYKPREMQTELLCLIFFHHQTTTFKYFISLSPKLCLIFFHHQTTTRYCCFKKDYLLCLIFFHHQTTTMYNPIITITNCVLSSFIIKPQHPTTKNLTYYIVSYLLSSSNHNRGSWTVRHVVLCLIFFHHQTTTQSLEGDADALIVSYLLSSSNHN